MKKSKNAFKRIYQKVLKIFDKDDVLSEINQIGFDIFKIALYDDKNVKFLSPKDYNNMYIVPKGYFINNDVNIFIKFTFNQIGFSRLIVVNHNYKYTFDIPEKTSDIMREMFENKVEEDRNKMEKEIMSNITDSLYQILSDFKERISKENENENGK